jgi:hypothetical protein
MPICGTALLALALTQPVVSVSPAVEPRRQVAKDVEIQLLGVKRADQMKMFPGAADTFVVQARPGFEFVVVRFAVVPRKTPAGPINVTTMAVEDTSGTRHPCAWGRTDMCDGTRPDTCEFPFPVPSGTKITAFHVEGLVFAVNAANMSTHGDASPARKVPRVTGPTADAPENATSVPADGPSKLTGSCDHGIPGGEPSAAYRAYFASWKDVKSVDAFLAQLTAADQARLSAVLSSASDDVRERFLAQVRQVPATSRLVITAEEVEGERAVLTVCLIPTAGTAPPRVATVVMVREGGVWRVAEEQQ